MIIPVERVDITIADGQTTATVALSKGQNISKSIPFATDQRTDDVSANADSDNYEINNVDVEVFDNAGTPSVRATNLEPTDTVILSVYVVEFSDNVNVQNGTFTLSGSTSTTASINSVDLSKAALVFYYRSSVSGDPDHFAQHSVRGNFTSDTQLAFTRQNNGGSITGHWYVFEDTGGNFDVQSTEFTLSGTSATSTISSVQMNKTFLIASYETTQTSDDVESGTITVDLQDSTTIRAIRDDSSEGTITVSAHAVTFTGAEFVQRGTMSFPASGAGNLQQTASITAVDLSRSMAWIPVRFLASSSGGQPGTGSSDNSAEQIRVNLTNSTTIQGDRDNFGANPADSAWEVIEWVINRAPNVTALDHPADNSWLNSVPIDFNFTVEDDYGFSN